MATSTARLVRPFSHAIAGNSAIITSSIWIDHNTLLIEYEKPSRFSRMILGLNTIAENCANQGVVPEKTAPRISAAAAIARTIESHITGSSRHSRRTTKPPRRRFPLAAACRRNDAPSTRPLST